MPVVYWIPIIFATVIFIAFVWTLLYSRKYIKVLKQNQTREIEDNIRQFSTWIEKSKEYAELNDESKVMLIKAINNYEWTAARWQNKQER